MQVRACAASLVTRNRLRRRSACHRPYRICWFIRISAEASWTIDRRTAIAGLMPARLLRIAARFAADAGCLGEFAEMRRAVYAHGAI
jgi:hypothetical protein